MRINELKDKIDKLGQKYDKNFMIEEDKYPNGQSYIAIYVGYPGCGYKIASIDLETRYGFSAIGISFYRLPGPLKEELFDILVEFARTPVEEREEIRKYQYRLKEKYLWISNRGSSSNNFLNLNYGQSTPYIILNDKGQVTGYKTKFTDKEIEELAEKYDIDLNMFDKVEVE